MNKKNIILLIISIIIFLGAILVFIYSKSLNTTKNKENQILSINTNNETKEDSFYFFDIDGNKLDFSSFFNKPNVVLFWKSDNSNSYDMINLIQNYYDSYKDKINFLVINVNEPDIDLDLIENVKAAKFKIPIYFDTDLKAYEKFQYEKLPALFFFKEDGSINKETLETITEDAFLANLDLLIENY